MKRDLDLLRAVLLHIFMFYPHERCLDLELPGYRPPQVQHHVNLLCESGLISRAAPIVSGDRWDNLRLTNAGYDFIALANDDIEWKAAKDLVMVRTGGQHFGLVREVLAARARAKLGPISNLGDD